jgi:hypothetical protein
LKLALCIFVFFVKHVGEAIESELPVRAMLLDPSFEQGKACRFDAAGADAADLLGSSQVALFEDLEMLTDGGESDAEGLSQSRDRDGPPAKQVEDGTARGIAECVKEAIDLRLRGGHRRLVSLRLEFRFFLSHPFLDKTCGMDGAPKLFGALGESGGEVLAEVFE